MAQGKESCAFFLFSFQVSHFPSLQLGHPWLEVELSVVLKDLQRRSAQPGQQFKKEGLTLQLCKCTHNAISVFQC